jgi:predicted nuclease of predicted toxin-antitoxin system
MKFIVDAQLPRRLARELAAFGHDAVHTLDFPAANRTPDSGIIARAIQEGRIVATKDNDFVTSFLLRGAPPKLLLISTGNISNDALSKLLARNLAALESAFANYDFVELSAARIITHAR